MIEVTNKYGEAIRLGYVTSMNAFISDGKNIVVQANFFSFLKQITEKNRLDLAYFEAEALLKEKHDAELNCLRNLY